MIKNTSEKIKKPQGTVKKPENTVPNGPMAPKWSVDNLIRTTEYRT